VLANITLDNQYIPSWLPGPFPMCPYPQLASQIALSTPKYTTKFLDERLPKLQ
jgi:hypothetical protein